MTIDDVPSRIDLRDPIDAAEWVAAADRTRPWRVQIRAAIAELVCAEDPAPQRMLEIGAGPGLLAEAILQRCPIESYTLFDFSQPMLDMSRARLADRSAAAFVRGDFNVPGWTELLPAPFDAVVAMQAVHETRHKERAARLYRDLHTMLRPDGLIVVCDHTPPDESLRSTTLHSTADEQHAALAASGFVDVTTPLVMNGLYVCSARRPRSLSAESSVL